MTRDPVRNLGENNPGFSSPRLDRLIEEHTEIVQDTERLAHYQRLMEVAIEELPLVPLFTRTYLYGVSERLRWEPRLDGKLLVAEMSLN